MRLHMQPKFSSLGELMIRHALITWPHTFFPQDKDSVSLTTSKSKVQYYALCWTVVRKENYQVCIARSGLRDPALPRAQELGGYEIPCCHASMSLPHASKPCRDMWVEMEAAGWACSNMAKEITVERGRLQPRLLTSLWPSLFSVTIWFHPVVYY